MQAHKNEKKIFKLPLGRSRFKFNIIQTISTQQQLFLQQQQQQQYLQHSYSVIKSALTKSFSSNFCTHKTSFLRGNVNTSIISMIVILLL